MDASYRDIQNRLRMLKTQGVYHGPLAGSKSRLAEALLEIDGVLPAPTLQRKRKPIVLSESPLPLANDTVLNEILPHLDWYSLFSFFSINRQAAKYRTSQVCWKRLLECFDDDELQEVLVEASKRGNLALLDGVSLAGRWKQVDERTSRYMCYYYTEKNNSDGVIATYRYFEHNGVDDASSKRAGQYHFSQLRPVMHRITKTIQLLQNPAVSPEQCMERITALISEQIWPVDTEYVAERLVSVFTPILIPGLQLLTSDILRPIVNAMAKAERLDLLQLLPLDNFRFYEPTVEYGSSEMLQTLGIAKKAKYSYIIGDRTLFLAQWKNARPIARMMLLRRSYRIFSPKEALDMLSQLTEKREETYKSIMYNCDRDGHTRWMIGFRSLYVERYGMPKADEPEEL